MAKNNTRTLRIATNSDRWHEITAQVDEAIANLCSDAHNAERFLLMVEFMTGENYDRNDQYIATSMIKQKAFIYTPEFESALESYTEKLNPDVASRGLRAVKTA